MISSHEVIKLQSFEIRHKRRHTRQCLDVCDIIHAHEHTYANRTLHLNFWKFWLMSFCSWWERIILSNSYYFGPRSPLKALFVLKVFKPLCWLCSCKKSGWIRSIRLISKFRTSQTGQQTIRIHIQYCPMSLKVKAPK